MSDKMESSQEEEVKKMGCLRLAVFEAVAAIVDALTHPIQPADKIDNILPKNHGGKSGERTR